MQGNAEICEEKKRFVQILCKSEMSCITQGAIGVNQSSPSNMTVITGSASSPGPHAGLMPPAASTVHPLGRRRVDQRPLSPRPAKDDSSA